MIKHFPRSERECNDLFVLCTYKTYLYKTPIKFVLHNQSMARTVFWAKIRFIFPALFFIYGKYRISKVRRIILKKH